MNPLLIGGVYLAGAVWLLSLARAAGRAGRAAKRATRLAALACQAQRPDLDDLLAEHMARLFIAERLREDREVALLDALYELPAANVVPITSAKRFRRPDATGGAA